MATTKSLLLVAATFGVVAAPSRATAVPTTFGSSAYEFIASGSMSWGAAKAAAEVSTYLGVSGHLVTIFSSAENAFVLGLLGSIENSIWIGATDEAVEGEWRWVTGEQFWQGNAGGSVGPVIPYANWAGGQPDNFGTGQHHATMFGPNVPIPFVPGQWDDGGAFGGAPGTVYSISGYVVEYDIEPVPEPSTITLLGLGSLAFVRRRLSRQNQA